MFVVVDLLPVSLIYAHTDPRDNYIDDSSVHHPLQRVWVCVKICYIVNSVMLLICAPSIANPYDGVKQYLDNDSFVTYVYFLPSFLGTKLQSIQIENIFFIFLFRHVISSLLLHVFSSFVAISISSRYLVSPFCCQTYLFLLLPFSSRVFMAISFFFHCFTNPAAGLWCKVVYILLLSIFLEGGSIKYSCALVIKR